MKPTSSPLWKQLLKTAVEIKIGKETVRIPTREGVLAAKLSAMVSLARRLPDKQQDGVDFIRIVEASDSLDEKLLAELGELVYPGGGVKILKHIEHARAGRPLSI